MRLKSQILITMAILSAYAASSMAIAPIGPPRAMLGQGQKGIGISYSHESMDLSAEGGNYREQQPTLAWMAQNTDLEIRDLQSDPVFASLHYGINQDWDVFVRIGVVNAKDEIQVDKTTPIAPTRFFNRGDQVSLNSGHEFAWGVGSRATFYENENVSWGGSFHMTWYDPETSSDTVVDSATGSTASVDLDLEYWEIVVSGGPTINLGNYWIYGGPFLHYVRGDLDIDGSWTNAGLGNFPLNGSADVEEESILGGQIGAQWNMKEDLCVNAEAAFTADAWGLSLSGIWRVN